MQELWFGFAIMFSSHDEIILNFHNKNPRFFPCFFSRFCQRRRVASRGSLLSSASATWIKFTEQQQEKRSDLMWSDSVPDLFLHDWNTHYNFINCKRYTYKMNIFRLVGDLSHLAAIWLLLWKIWKSRSVAGLCSYVILFQLNVIFFKLYI